MCLITTQKRVKIAKEDMTVYKILQNNLKSPYTYFQYRRRETYKTTISPSDEWSCFDDEDHAYLNKHFEGWDRGNHRNTLKCFGSGFHAANSKDRLLHALNDEIIFICTVPAGSKYYEDATGLIVSNQIIINRKA